MFTNFNSYTRRCKTTVGPMLELTLLILFQSLILLPNSTMWFPLEPAILFSYHFGCCVITSSMQSLRTMIYYWFTSGDYVSVYTAEIRKFALFPFLNITNIHFIQKRSYTSIYPLIESFSYITVPCFHTYYQSIYHIPLPVPFLCSIWLLCPGWYIWIPEICVCFWDSCYQPYFVPEEVLQHQVSFGFFY